MALITVAELLHDPDFIDPVTVARQVQEVDTDGLAVVTEVKIQIYASIQSASGDDLTMTPDLARTESTFEVITTFPLLTATDATAADEVIWRGQRFTVINIGRFGNWAGNAGHYEGTMRLKPTVPEVGNVKWDDDTMIWDDGEMIWQESDLYG
jgi:hypothetical protein